MGNKLTVSSCICLLISVSNSQCSNPCNDNSVVCDQFQECKDFIINCGTNTNCNVECGAGSNAQMACYGATINAPNVDALLDVVCGVGDNQECAHATINAGYTNRVELNCNGGSQACTSLTLNATNANIVNVDCNGFTSCQSGMKVYCGTGDCTVNCNNNGNGACIGLQLICGTGDCFMDCTSSSQNNKCGSVVIDISQASSFDCGGSAQDCQSVTLITAEPTINPTTSQPITSAPTIGDSPTNGPITVEPTTSIPTTSIPTTLEPTTSEPTTSNPSTSAPITAAPITLIPTTSTPITAQPVTSTPITSIPTSSPITSVPVTSKPITPQPITNLPTTYNPADTPITSNPTYIPTTIQPITSQPTHAEHNVDASTRNTAENTHVNAESENTGSNDWVYILVPVVLVIVCYLFGIITFIKYRKKHAQQYLQKNTHKMDKVIPSINEHAIRKQIGQQSTKNDFGEQLGNNVPASNDSNLLMDDGDDDDDEMITPMGNGFDNTANNQNDNDIVDAVNFITPGDDIEMGNMNDMEGLNDNDGVYTGLNDNSEEFIIDDDSDVTPSGDNVNPITEGGTDDSESRIFNDNDDNNHVGTIK